MSKPKTALQILIAARKLIARRGGWVKGTYAKTASGKTTDILSPDAAAFCSIGAIMKVGMGGPGSMYPHACNHLAVASGIFDIPAFNDKPATTKRQVLAAFDKAIKHARKRKA